MSTICGSLNEILINNLLKKCAELVTTVHETGAVKCPINPSETISLRKVYTASVTDINKANPVGSTSFVIIVKTTYNYVLLFD